VENVYFKTATPGEYKAIINHFSGHSPKEFKATLTVAGPVTLADGEVLEGGTKLVEGVCSHQNKNVTVFEFTVENVTQFDRQAFASLAKRGAEVSAFLRSIDVNFALIDSKSISGWMPESNRWPKFKQNVDAFVKAAAPTGYHLNAANAAEVSSRFEEVAEMMDEETMKVEVYS
jgi:hypothetical protein